MKNNLDLKSLWHSHSVPEANQTDILKRMDIYNRTALRKALILNGALALTILAVMLIWIYFQPQFLSTKFGIVLVVLAMVILMFFNGRIIPLYKKADRGASNLNYLKTQLEIKTRSYFIQTRIMSLYFILLSVGIGLYMYEYTVRMPMIWAVAAYVIIFLWFGFTWFVMRPQIIRKTRLKMEALVSELEKLKDQID